MNLSDEESFKLVNELGMEAYEAVSERVRTLGVETFDDHFALLSGAAVVFLANVLRPGIERAKDRVVAADGLVSVAANHVRVLLGPIVKATSQGTT